MESVNARFCYRIEKEAEWARDSEGNPVHCYSEVSLDVPDGFTEEAYDKAHKDIVRNHLAIKIHTKPEYVTPISIAEYDENVEGDED